MFFNDLLQVSAELSDFQTENASLKSNSEALSQRMTSETSELQRRLAAQEGKVSDLQGELSALQGHYDEQCQAADEAQAPPGIGPETIAEAQRVLELKVKEEPWD